MSVNFKMLAKTFFGFEDLLENELNQLGAQEVEKGNRVVYFKGDKGFMYKANLSLRTALKILVPIYHCRINSEHDLYQVAYDYPWEQHFTSRETFAIDSVVFGETFTHSLYVSQKVKDAIVDSFRAKTGQRPSVNLKFPDVRINVHIDREQCTISLDSSSSSDHSLPTFIRLYRARLCTRFIQRSYSKIWNQRTSARIRSERIRLDQTRACLIWI